MDQYASPLPRLTWYFLPADRRPAWSGPCDIDAFIDVSKQGKKQGVFIQHRECGTLVELGPVNTGSEDVDDDTTTEGTTTRRVRRAVGKMKATITQRFVNPDDDVEFDVDCDCRFIFFCEKVLTYQATTEAATLSATSSATPTSPPATATSLLPSAAPRWRTVYVKLIYEKDKIVPADGHSYPKLTADERQYMRESLPDGYRYLGVMQRRLGYVIDEKLPTPRNAGWERMYSAMEAWLAGRKVTLG